MTSKQRTDQLTHPRRLTLVALGLIVATSSPSHGTPGPNPVEDEAREPQREAEAPAAPRIEYGRKGLDIWSADERFHIHIDWRAQLRATSSESDRGTGDATSKELNELVIKRARFKLGGHAYREWLGYYLEYDFPSSRLLDMRFTLAPRPEIGVRVGQWKIPFNRERIDSSGKQQFADRSIVNKYFTLDRQQGAMLFGRLGAGTFADSSYDLGVFTGTGRGGGGSDSGNTMLLGRYRWNFLRRELAYSQSDTGHRTEPAAVIAVAGARYRGPFTAFSSSGGGQLPSFDEGDGERYDIEQVMIETAFQYRGFSWQQEAHWKSIDDTELEMTTDLHGYYLQAGLFPHTLFGRLPRPLEIAGRYATVDPDDAVDGDRHEELTLAFNWFFAGHRNKLTLDFSQLSEERGQEPDTEEHRLRLQWDISF